MKTTPTKEKEIPSSSLFYFLPLRAETTVSSSANEISLK